MSVSRTRPSSQNYAFVVAAAVFVALLSPAALRSAPGVFAVFYDLDGIATAPPTVRQATEAFGDRDGPIVFGWIAAGREDGAATAALTAGVTRAAQACTSRPSCWPASRPPSPQAPRS